ncbi:MAG: prepilin-type N-terminal cleavage/methylation domain-containing protein [Bacillus sp. (in: Bacteria)]|nr:prepilin-type N-terminal cleavage/methylation domain-containing protein [Bacillus sp. (in: firmicutes)]
MNRDERGLTLVEVLATLILLSIVSVIIWSVFFQGYKFSQKAISKNFMLQEANILTTSLTKIHRTLEIYEITSENCGIKVTNLKTTPPQDQVFNHPNICFKLLEINNVSGTGPKITEPHKNGNDISLKVSVSDKKDPNNNLTIDTFLYRVKGADYQ